MTLATLIDAYFAVRKLRELCDGGGLRIEPIRLEVGLAVDPLACLHGPIKEALMAAWREAGPGPIRHGEKLLMYDARTQRPELYDPYERPDSGSIEV